MKAPAAAANGSPTPAMIMGALFRSLLTPIAIIIQILTQNIPA